MMTYFIKDSLLTLLLPLLLWLLLPLEWTGVEEPVEVRSLPLGEEDSIL